MTQTRCLPVPAATARLCKSLLSQQRIVIWLCPHGHLLFLLYWISFRVIANLSKMTTVGTSRPISIGQTYPGTWASCGPRQCRWRAFRWVWHTNSTLCSCDTGPAEKGQEGELMTATPRCTSWLCLCSVTQTKASETPCLTSVETPRKDVLTTTTQMWKKRDQGTSPNTRVLGASL